eukprot:COSAG01_NODE_22199_length_867_cov_1.407552_1_plen_145_part_00
MTQTSVWAEDLKMTISCFKHLRSWARITASRSMTPTRSLPLECNATALMLLLTAHNAGCVRWSPEISSQPLQRVPCMSTTANNVLATLDYYTTLHCACASAVVQISRCERVAGAVAAGAPPASSSRAAPGRSAPDPRPSIGRLD